MDQFNVYDANDNFLKTVTANNIDAAGNFAVRKFGQGCYAATASNPAGQPTKTPAIFYVEAGKIEHGDEDVELNIKYASGMVTLEEAIVLLETVKDYTVSRICVGNHVIEVTGLRWV